MNVNDIDISDNLYKGSYPSGLDLFPDSVQHQSILDHLLPKVKAGRTSISSKFETWKKIDDLLNVRVTLTDEEKDVLKFDPRKPVSMVLPVMGVAKETILTYFNKAFGTETLIKYNPVEDKDAVKALVLEKVIDTHVKRNNIMLDLNTFWSNCLTYSFGVAAVTWETMSAGGQIIKEGSVLTNVSPYNFIPDPNVSLSRIHDSECVGWGSVESKIKLLSLEASGNGYFNVQYLDEHSKSSILRDDDFGSDSMDNASIEGLHDVMYLYTQIIPATLGLGANPYPERWLFVIVGDRIIIKAERLDETLGMYPLIAASLDTDGPDIFPASRMEKLLGLQGLIDWLISSHVTNIRKSLNDMLIVDPSLVNMSDLTDPGAGKLIRMRRSAWGTAKVGDAIHQLDIRDVTQQNIPDADYFTNLMNRVSGASDGLQGVQMRGGERVSATEAQQTGTSALSRLARLASLVSMQAHTPLGYILAFNAKRFMSKSVYLKLVSSYEEKLIAEYAQKDPVNFFMASSADFDINFDVAPHDGSTQDSIDVQAWNTLFATIVSNPLITPLFDVGRVFKHIARLMGAKNVDDFVIAPTQAPTVPIAPQPNGGTSDPS